MNQHMTRNEIIQIFKDRVLSWDCQDILDLSNMLYDLNYSIQYDWDAGMDCWRETDEKLEDYLDFSALPSCQIPADIIPEQRVWAMDKNGRCLISLDFDSTNFGHIFDHMIKSINQLQPKK